MTYWERWKRGLDMLLYIAVAAASSALMGVVVGFVAMVIILFATGAPDWDAQANSYLWFGGASGLIILGPNFLCQLAEAGKLSVEQNYDA